MLGNNGEVRVFISYSHDSLSHRERVLGLAQRLRKNAVACVIDRFYEDTLDIRWTAWMRDQLEQAKFVLVVCTEGYLRRLSSTDPDSPGRGTNYEGSLIDQELYDARGKTRFFPIYFSEQDRQFTPKFLNGYQAYNVDTEAGYTKLYRLLTNQPEVTAEPLGPPLVLSPASVPPPLPPVPPSKLLSSAEQRTMDRVLELAFAYQQIRQDMLPSDERTRRMDVIAAKMRALACDAYFLLPELSRSEKPGSRLAAVSLLEVKPALDYLDWLASRLMPEKPFVGYRAALALVSAARTLGHKHRPRVLKAVEEARQNLGPAMESTDRRQALDFAFDELDRASSIEKEYKLGVG